MTDETETSLQPWSAEPVCDRLGLPDGVTAARLALGRVGASQPTRAVLAFALDHARARDAVHTALDFEALAGDLRALGLETIRVESAAPDRQTYLRRPDFGRKLSDASRALLRERELNTADLVIMVGDGLSSTAVQQGAAPLIAGLMRNFEADKLTVAPIVLASQARVAMADEIGEAMGARLSLVLIGERPGLSAADSLGAYLTFAPRVGRTDAERNCVSNIRSGGLSPDAAAFKLSWLIRQALASRTSGVRLKDDSDIAAIERLAEAKP